VKSYILMLAFRIRCGGSKKRLNVGGVTVKVRELIEHLQKLDPELNVYHEDTEGTFKVENVVLCAPSKYEYADDIKEWHVSLS